MKSDKRQSHCMFCSLCCPISIEQRPRGSAQTANITNGSGNNSPLCYRGQYLAPLLTHPKRIHSASMNQTADHDSLNQDAIYRKVTDTLCDAAAEDKLGILLSGNLPTSEIAAAVRYFKLLLPSERISIFLPPSDISMWTGFLRSQSQFIGHDNLSTAQCIFAIGDLLGTHPVLAGQLMSLREKNPKTGLINLDSIPGRTMRFANLPLQVKMGDEIKGLLSLAITAGVDIEEHLATGLTEKEIISGSGLDPDELNTCIQSLKSDKHSVIALTLPFGRYQQNELMALITGWIAQATESKVLPLYTYSGTPGSMTVMHSQQISHPAQWLQAAEKGQFETLFLIDVDLAGQLPTKNFTTLTHHLKELVVAAPILNQTTAAADIVLPLAFNHEMDGQLINQMKESIEVHALKKPPGSACSLTELLTHIPINSDIDCDPDYLIDSDLNFNFDTKSYDTTDDSPFSFGDCDLQSFRITSRTESLHLFDAYLSNQLDWPLTIEPVPIALIHPNDAAKLNIKENDRITIAGEQNEIDMTAKISDIVPQYTLSIPSPQPMFQNLFEWQIFSHSIEVKPHSIEIVSHSHSQVNQNDHIPGTAN